MAISNGTADVHRVGLGAYFLHAVNAPTLGKAKPEPDIYRHAADLAGLQPWQVLHIGDDARLDAWAARNAGMACIWVNRGNKAWDQPGPPPVTVRGLAEIQRWIEGL